MCGIAHSAEIRNYDGSDCPQLRDDFPCVVEPAHMRIAGGESAVRSWMVRVFLDAKPQTRYRFIEASAEEMCRTYQVDRRADARPRAEA